MSKAKIHVVYDGDAVRGGSMDVMALAPALLSIGELFQRANKIINGDQAEVTVHVKSDFQKGSFGCDLEVVQTILSQAKSLFGSDDYKAAKEIIAVLFGGGSLYGLLRWLKGKKEESTTTLENGNIKIEITGGGNNSIEVKPQVFNLYQDKNVRESIKGALGPLKQQGIDVFEVRTDEKIIERVVKEEVEYFFVEKEGEIPQMEQIIPESTRVAALEIFRLSFKEENKWVFSDGSGGNINAAIVDEEFWEKLNKREITFGKGDTLKVSIQTKTFHKSGQLHTEHTILKVLAIISPKQLDLFKTQEN